MIGRGVLDAIGSTPIIKLRHMTDHNVYAKAEFLNPGGSIKDRVAKYMLERAEQKGRLKPGMTIVEPTSGNTGIGISLVGVHKGYRVCIVMPEDMSDERKKIVKALGAELVLTPPKDSIPGSVAKASEMAQDPSVFVPQQFENPDNPECHYLQTGPEIWKQTGGVVDAFVAGVGSGGTLGGVGKFLKEKKPEVRVVAVEPENSAALLGHEPGLHQIQGIGDGFVPPVLDVSLIDQIVTISDEQAVETTRQLAREEGLLCGTSSGANVWSAIQIAEQLGQGSTVVTVLPDRAERYFSTSLI